MKCKSWIVDVVRERYVKHNSILTQHTNPTPEYVAPSKVPYEEAKSFLDDIHRVPYRIYLKDTLRLCDGNIKVVLKNNDDYDNIIEYRCTVCNSSFDLDLPLEQILEEHVQPLIEEMV